MHCVIGLHGDSFIISELFGKVSMVMVAGQHLNYIVFCKRFHGDSFMNRLSAGYSFPINDC